MRGSAVYAHLWSTPEVDALLGDEGRLASWLDILAALARAQGELGLIPGEVADEIARRALVENLDLDYVADQTRSTEHSTLGLIRGVQQVVSPEAGEWFGYGATVQDVADTWFALVMRDMGRIAERDLAAIETAVRKLARLHKATPMAARTHGQPGLPVTFGYKAAVWAAEIRRHRERLGDGGGRWLVGQLRLAVGRGPSSAAGSVLRRARPRTAGGAVDLGPRPAGRVRIGDGHDLRHPGQDRQRGAGAAAARDRRGLRAVHPGGGGQHHHAPQAEPGALGAPRDPGPPGPGRGRGTAGVHGGRARTGRAGLEGR